MGVTHSVVYYVISDTENEESLSKAVLRHLNILESFRRDFSTRGKSLTLLSMRYSR